MPEKQQGSDLPSSFSPQGGMNGAPAGNGSAAVLNEVAVKVACRVRPLNNREKLHQHQPCVRISSETNQIVIGKDKVFSFDHVIPPKITQAELYDQCVKNLVQSLFEGYNATVFAYGQTGSGKTHTISGSKTSTEDFGIIPRAVQSMFQIINSSSLSPVNSNSSHRSNLSNREFCVKVNFIEIYKEELKDLLDSAEKDLQIREDESGNTIIYGANEVICTTLEEVMACFDAGILLRHTGSTLMNEQSSRSHSVFTVSIEQRWSDVGTNKTTRDSSTLYDLSNGNNGANSYYLGAKFHFVDLAGSERVHRTGNVGDRFKESIHINSGLLALGNVISALSSNDSKKKAIHIPYRESKITRILKDSLGGNANTLMICCISPSSCNLDESINALKYASRARYIKNKPIVNMDPQTQRFVEMQGEIQALREELHRQRTALISVTGHYGPNVGQNANQDDSNEIKQLEASLQAAQSEADYYKKLVKEAFGRFKQLSKVDTNVSSVVTKKMVDEWLNMFEASKNKADFDIEDYAKQKIAQLELQLKQAIDDLKSDEEIFSDKEKEINSLKETINELNTKLNVSNRYLDEAFNKEKEQQELMLQLQIQIDRLMQNKQQPVGSTNEQKNFGKQNSEHNLFRQASQMAFGKANHNENSNINLFNSPSGGKIAMATNKSQSLMGNLNNNQVSIFETNNANLKQRAKTAPNGENILNGNQNVEKKNRTIYSSPALFTLERVMQSFRARSQILAETLEENDNVLQKRFNSTFDVEPEELDENEIENKSNEQTSLDEYNGDPDSNDANKFVRRGTFKVEKDKQKGLSLTENKIDAKKTSIGSVGSKEMPQETQKKLRDMSINIRMKEELIKELVANSKFTNRINLQYQHKIESLQKEINQYKNDINDLQRQLLLTTNSKEPLAKTEIELKKQLELSRQKIADLESKQKDQMKTIGLNGNADKRVIELELALSKMRQQNDMLQKKLKEDLDRKQKLEKEYEKEQQKLKELETRSEQQQKVLKKKSEDLVNAQRRLRSGSNTNLPVAATPDGENLANKHWVEQEMEKLIIERRQMELFKDELKKREELIKKKELLVQEKNELQIKKLRSSQMNKENLLLIDQKIDNLNKQIQQQDSLPSLNNLKDLEETHSSLVKQRKLLDDRLSKGAVLNPGEERRLIEIDEAIEAIEIAIDYKTDSIKDHQNRLRDSILFNENQNDSEEIFDNVLQKLNTVPQEETKHLVRRFFKKIIDLKEVEQKKHFELSELQLQLEEQTRMSEQLKLALSVSSSELERRLVDQKSKAEKNMKSLTNELNECNSKISLMEKEISFYKEKLIKLKALNKSSSNLNLDADFESSNGMSSNNQTGLGTGSFHINSSNGLSNDTTIAQNLGNSSKMESLMNASVPKSVKVSRNNLRRLTEEELLKRSLKKT